MVFSSPEFLFFFLPVTLAVYFAVPARYLKARNLALLFFSLLFYGWGEPVYVLLMAFTIAVDWVSGLLMEKYAAERKTQKKILVCAIVLNLSILFFFKYADFFLDNLRLIPLLSGLPRLGLSLPVGISFYTFQSLSYVIDIYRGEANVQKNIVTFGAYVSMFPQLIAGPIVRYSTVDKELREREHSVFLFSSGVRTFLCGLGKKILLANVAGQLWGGFSAVPADERTVLGSWLGILFYTFQIYFDFSGYSDMAIGLGKMLGFRFLENFDYPYIAQSVTDFWRRWHISLSTWFREYVYIPLGGNREGKWKLYRNLFAVWFLTGFWHGASWNFLLWGLYYFALLVVEKTFLLKALEKIPSFFRHLYSLFFIVIGWLLFVSDDIGGIGGGIVYLGDLFGIGTKGLASSLDLFDLVRNLLFLCVLVLASTPLPKKLFRGLYEKAAFFRSFAVPAGCVALFVLCSAYLIDSDFNPFLYFRF